MRPEDPVSELIELRQSSVNKKSNERLRAHAPDAFIDGARSCGFEQSFMNIQLATIENANAVAIQGGTREAADRQN
jgi:hypothetical protein